MMNLFISYIFNNFVKYYSCDMERAQIKNEPEYSQVLGIVVSYHLCILKVLSSNYYQKSSNKVMII